jgi:hypothetical protein
MTIRLWILTLTVQSPIVLLYIRLYSPQYSVCAQHFPQTIQDETPVAQHTHMLLHAAQPKVTPAILHPKRTMPAPAINTFSLKLPQWVTHEVGVNPTLRLDYNCL